MEPDVIRMYSSSPPPMEDGTEEEDDEFGDFDTFSGVPNSISFTDFDTPTTFNQTQALTATSPPELSGGGRGVTGYSLSNGSHAPGNEPSKANGVARASRPGGGPSERTEMKKLVSGSLSFSTSDSCNGSGAEVLTNGFVTFDLQGNPSSQNSVHSHVQETSSEDMGSAPVCGPEDDFADFAAFSDTEGRINHTASEDLNDPVAAASCPADATGHDAQETSEDNVRDTNRPGIFMSGIESVSVPTEQNTDRTTEATATDVCTNSPLAVNGGNAAERDESKDELFPDSEAGQSDETETETSLGRPLSTDALEEYGDMSTTGSVPSPPLQGETSTPADHSQLPEDDEDEDFGDFGDAGSFGGQGFADFDQLEQSGSTTAQESADGNNDDDFGDFNSPKLHSNANKEHDRGEFADFPVSDSFGNFSSAIEDVGTREDTGWSAFGEQQGEGESWAAFGAEQSVTPPAESGEKGEEEEEEEEEWHEGDAPAASEDDSRTHGQTVSLSSRLEKLFTSSFPHNAAVSAAPVEEQVASLHVLLEEKPEPGGEEQRSWRGGVWTQLQDIHEAFGLRYQWGGSHCNKVLLCCLGIDTRNILFTGQKKQPVIVPMYAASLGMLEPTKEPVKPVSAAEMIASIAQTPPPLAPEKTSCSTDSVQQESLPPVQFDWSSSGLTNPLDASGGSSLLNLDFFGPVEDSGSSSSPSIPGVDPELYELTTAKLDPSGSSSRVADAFARLMSTMEKTSTSTRKPRKDENLSDEAVKVIAALPDLSFMQAKVLMFPATLTPLGSQVTSD